MTITATTAPAVANRTGTTRSAFTAMLRNETRLLRREPGSPGRARRAAYGRGLL